MDPLADTIPTTYSCPLCPWGFESTSRAIMTVAVTNHDREVHDIPQAGSEPTA